MPKDNLCKQDLSGNIVHVLLLLCVKLSLLVRNGISFCGHFSPYEDLLKNTASNIATYSRRFVSLQIANSGYCHTTNEISMNTLTIRKGCFLGFFLESNKCEPGFRGLHLQHFTVLVKHI